MAQKFEMERLPDPDGSKDAEVTAEFCVPREVGVLLVESDPDTQWGLARMLTIRGARVVGTSSGEAAVALSEQWTPDLVLIEHGLPGISGAEVARRIRAMHPHVPVALMSRDQSPDLRLAARVIGADHILAKPLRPETVSELLRCVRARLDASHSAEPAYGVREAASAE